jgi:hypothetical protein
MRPLLCALLLLLPPLSGCQRELHPQQEPTSGERSERDEALSAFPCVHFRELQRHLPKTLEGLERIRTEGSSGRYGEVAISEAERVFLGTDGQELSVRIVDTSLVDELGPAIIAAARDSRAAPGEPDAAILGEHAIGFVRFDPHLGRAEANLLVADRFVVAVIGRGHPDALRVREVAERIDVNGLALLR